MANKQKAPPQVPTADGADGMPRGSGKTFLEQSGNTYQPDPGELVRIIARKVPWPSLEKQPNRSGLRLRWAALLEDGTVLVPLTEMPLADGAHVLATAYALHPETLVTQRHEDKAFDSFVPMPLKGPAAIGARRAAQRAGLASKRDGLRKETPGSGGDGPESPNDLKVASDAPGEAE